MIRKHTGYAGKTYGPGKLNTGLITLVVDETRFMVDPDMFRQHSNTMLGRMFRFVFNFKSTADENSMF